MTTYYVSEASIHLLSAQCYFQANNEGQCLITARDASFTLAYGTELKIPYNSSNNLPLMQPSQVSWVGLMFKDALLLQDGHTPSSYMSITHESNQNPELKKSS